VKKRFFLKKIISILLITLVSLGNGYYLFNNVHALTLDEINAQIAKQQEELKKINADIALINKQLTDSKSQQNTSKSEISKVLNTISGLESQLQLLDLQSKQTAEEINIKNLQKNEVEKRQDVQIIDSYVTWKLEHGVISGNTDLIKQTLYNEIYQETTKSEILGLATDIDKLNLDKSAFEQQKEDLNKQIVSYSEQKAILQKQVDSYNSAVANANSSLSAMRSKSSGVQQQISLLTEQQKAIQTADDNITNGSGGGSNNVIVGQVFFTGTGRDRYQGHGVGMSQWGAYGAAKKGWSAEQILKLYYTNVAIEVRTGPNMHVVGGDGYDYGTMDIETYVSGLGEVPNQACGTSDQIIAWNNYANTQGWANNDPRRAKYVIDNPGTIWDCWPEEAIKAQVIASRSYGATSSQPICDNANCQVYRRKGTANCPQNAQGLCVGKAWAAYETAGKYIISKGSTHNNQIIRALYSSDNSQGYGTADSDTIFSNLDGVGTFYSYLRHADDTAVAPSMDYTHWAWRTNGYTVQKIDEMLTFASNHYTTGGTSNFLKGVRSTIGNLQTISLIKDGSNRVKQVKLVGDKGQKVMAGWLFKAIWNDWINVVRPTGQEDYIYSLTFSYQIKQ
jgi:SpoIID/LytB domain protein